MKHLGNFLTTEDDDVDHPLLDNYLGALLDSCHDCWLTKLDAIAENPATFTDFIKLATTAFSPVIDHPELNLQSLVDAAHTLSLDQRRYIMEYATGILLVLTHSSVYRPQADAP